MWVFMFLIGFCSKFDPQGLVLDGTFHICTMLEGGGACLELVVCRSLTKNSRILAYLPKLICLISILCLNFKLVTKRWHTKAKTCLNEVIMLVLDRKEGYSSKKRDSWQVCTWMP